MSHTPTSSAEILKDFIERLPEVDWETSPPSRFVKTISFAKEWGPHSDRVNEVVCESLGLSEFELQILKEMPEDLVHQSFVWRVAKDLGLGANVALGRDWDVYPKEGFFGDYLEYTLNSEAPPEFHFFSAAVALGAACKRNFLLRVGHIKVWPNLWAVLVAPSGIARKTSACNIASKLVAEIPNFNVVTNTSTPEFLTEQLQGSSDLDPEFDKETGVLDFHRTASQGFICAPELGVFLGKQQYNEGMIQRLTELSDNPDYWTSGTRKDGKGELFNVSLSLLGAITPDWLRDAVPRAAHGGGFMSRILWIYKENTDRRLPFPPPPSPLLEARLVRHLQLVASAQPAILHPSQETMQWFSGWYNELYADTPEDRRVSGYTERKPTNLLRLAGLLTLAEPDQKVYHVAAHRECEIPLRNVHLALKILDSIEEPQMQAVRAVDASPGADQLTRIRRAVYRLCAVGNPEVMRSDLLRRLSSYMGAKELDNHLSTLIQSKEVDRDERKRGSGQMVIYYSKGEKFDVGRM